MHDETSGGRVTAEMRGRYAPSPTGDLHLGNLRTALLAWMAARRSGGRFVLRIEDLDRPRTRPGATQRIIDDLRWLGLEWDEGPDVGGMYGPYEQSRREAIYDAALARLRDAGAIYPCFCSRADLARIASVPAGAEDEPPYPGICRSLSPREVAARLAAGRRPAWRFRVPSSIIRFSDGGSGPQEQNVATVVGDFIVRRSDGIIAYQLAVVVDDALMRITQVVRGADLLGSTARQIALFRALGWPPPAYHHVPVMTGSDGAKLSKREAAAGLEPLRAAGATAASVVGMLASSAGLWPGGSPIAARDLLAFITSGQVS
jgi:glutamyl-tRNA synthetase